jgi:brefeldin A-resistance guanine nucleotide exchange factor 1
VRAGALGFQDPNEAPQLPAVAIIPLLHARKQKLQEGIKLFNEKPSKGIAFLQQAGLLADPLQPREVALFLKADPTLDKARIGEYIGALGNKIIMEAFVRSFDYSRKGPDEGLRALLTSFRLPGEAQIIERIVEVFADEWFATYEGKASPRARTHARVCWGPGGGDCLVMHASSTRERLPCW